MCKMTKWRCCSRSRSSRAGIFVVIFAAIMVANVSSRSSGRQDGAHDKRETRNALESLKEKITSIFKSVETASKDLDEMFERLDAPATKVPAPLPPNAPSPPIDPDDISGTKLTPTASQETSAPAIVPTNVQAEVTEEESSDNLKLLNNDLDLEQTQNKPILGPNTPDWIRQRVVSDEEIIVPVESSLCATLEECRQELEAKLPLEICRLLDDPLLKNVKDENLTKSDREFIRKNFVVKDREFDNVQDRPSGHFHQLWVQVRMDKSQLNQLRRIVRPVMTQSRIEKIGILGAMILAITTGLSGAVGMLARRENSKAINRKTPVT